MLYLSYYQRTYLVQPGPILYSRHFPLQSYLFWNQRLPLRAYHNWTSPPGFQSIISCLPQTAKYVRESYDALVDSFESIDNLLSRLKIYTMIKPTSTIMMTAMVIKIMVELWVVLALTTSTLIQVENS